MNEKELNFRTGQLLMCCSTVSNALLGYVTKIGALWKELSYHTNSVFNGPPILGGIRVGKVDISV